MTGTKQEVLLRWQVPYCLNLIQKTLVEKSIADICRADPIAQSEANKHTMMNGLAALTLR
jgi:hypothetical protein